MRASRRESRFLAATCALAIGVPLLAATWLDRRVATGLAPTLGRAAGQHVTIGGIEAGVSGDLRIQDVVVGELLAAEAIEAAVSLDSLLAGELSADEIRVVRPRIRAHVRADGQSDWHDLLRRFAGRRSNRSSDRASRRLRRIVVSEGDLVADVAGVQVTAREVALHPQAGGVRLVTGAVEINGALGGFGVRGDLARVGADVRLPDLAIRRLMAVGGRAAVTAGGHTLTAAAVDVRRDRGDAPWRLSALIDDRGAPRRVELAAQVDAGRIGLAIDADRIPLGVLSSLAPDGIGVADAHASGSVSLAFSPEAPWSRLSTAIKVGGVTVTHRALAGGPVELDGALALEVGVDGDRIDVIRATAGRAGLTIESHGWLRRARGRVVAADLVATVGPVPCRGLIDALPLALRGPLDELTVRGTLNGGARLRFDLDDPGADGLELAVDVDPDTCEVVAEAPGADPRLLAGVVVHTFPDGSQRPVGPGSPDWIEPHAVPGFVRGAFVAAEDARFWTHRGFDGDQIARSLEIDLREDRFARGGSTISQQLVKNAFLHHDRTLARKLQEAVLTWRLEAALDKNTILTRYLNIIELGPGVFGIGAAARHWFGKAPHELSVREAAFLAALTPAPRTIAARIARVHGIDAETAERVDVVVRAMRRAGVIDGDGARIAQASSLVLRADALR